MTQTTVFPADPKWEGEGTSRIPFWAYTREDLYKKELDQFFYNSHWCYVGLEAEIPNAGDYRRTVVGERSVIMVRDPDGGINVIENVCAHRGMRFCRERNGNAKDFFCPYHQWNYSVKGDLQGVPFRRGVKQDGKINGGMPKDFKVEDHGLTKLKVATRGGVVGPYYKALIDYTRDCVSNLGTEFPEWKGMGYRIAGIGWHQGWNDRVDKVASANYEANLVDLIPVQGQDAAVRAHIGGDTGQSRRGRGCSTQVFQPVLNPFHWSAGLAGGQAHQHDIGKDRLLDAEAAA